MAEVSAATAYTHAFVRAALPPPAGRILEIGCGDGALAALLQADGLDLVAVETDRDCVAAASARGIDVRYGEWPCAIEGPFDAVLFTRSLHHVHDLAGGIAAAKQALAPGGRLIVEDFRAEGGSARSTAWYLAMVRELHEGGALADNVDPATLAGKIGPPGHDEHELHASSVIRDELAGCFSVEEAESAYYFRYLEPHLREGSAASWLLDIELEQIADGTIDALGKRFVGRLRPE